MTNKNIVHENSPGAFPTDMRLAWIFMIWYRMSWRIGRSAIHWPGLHQHSWSLDFQRFDVIRKTNYWESMYRKPLNWPTFPRYKKMEWRVLIFTYLWPYYLVVLLESIGMLLSSVIYSYEWVNFLALFIFRGLLRISNLESTI